MTTRSRRQTRTRLTTGYPPELHNAEVRARKSMRRALISAQTAFRIQRRAMRQFAAAFVAFSAAARPAELEQVKSEQRWQRRDRIDSDDCIRCMTATSTTPMHDASPSCQSGGRDHCTCSTCY